MNILHYQAYIHEWQKGNVTGMRGKGGLSRHIRRYLFEKYGYRCSKCDWCEINPVTNLQPLEVNHIDGNHKNNLESNLELLCPNCHSLTPTYKSLNIGFGRKRK